MRFIDKSVVPEPRIGDTRSKMRFAWLPTVVEPGVRIWLERYKRTETWYQPMPMMMRSRPAGWFLYTYDPILNNRTVYDPGRIGEKWVIFQHGPPPPPTTFIFGAATDTLNKKKEALKNNVAESLKIPPKPRMSRQDFMAK